MVVQYGGFTILSSPFFIEGLLPFLLVFSLVFAVLQKSQILGNGKRQIDALVSLAIGLMVIAFAQAVGIILQMVTFLAVALVIVLVFMILVGSLFKEGSFDLHAGWKWAISGLAFLAVAIAALVYTGGWDWIMNFIDSSGSSLWTNIVFIVIIVGAVALVVLMGGKSASSGSSGNSGH